MIRNQIVSHRNPAIAWWSGGVTSAVACKLALELFGASSVRIVFIDTRNEDEDTYRFKDDCEVWYGKEIERLTNEAYEDIRAVWYKFKSLNVANGAICSSELKREMRMRFQKENPYSTQVFGFDIDEPKRAKSMTLNYENANPIYPLLMMGYTKKRCIEILQENGIVIPRSYTWGFHNNNCLKTGCVQGGIGYWQKMMRERPDLFNQMAEVEHDLTNLKGAPVTMLKDQGKNGGLVFLKPHPAHPHIKDITMMKGREPKPLMECNGLCGIDDLQGGVVVDDLNFAE